MSPLATAIVFLLAIPATAFAIEPGDSCPKSGKLPPRMICSHESVVINCAETQQRRIESLLCVDDEYKNADKRLNALYQGILKNMKTSEDSPLKKQLIEGQRAWVRFKEADCEIEGEFAKPGMWGDVFVVGCQLEHTKQRIKVLEGRFGK